MRLTALVLAGAVAAVTAPAQQALSGARPNILFVFSDDHASHAISAYGSRINETPNIDRLATSGVLFRNNFCGNAICGPSRATILTGQHSHGNGFMRNGNTFDGAQTTFPKLLQQAGYQTALIGKWHLESEPTGFDHWLVLPGQGEYYNPDFLSARGRERHEGHVTDLTTQFAIEWLGRRDTDKPFLLMCQHKAPHRNWQPAPQELGLYRDADVPEPATLFDDWAGRAAPLRAQAMTIAQHLTLHYDMMLPPAPGETLRGLDQAWTAQRRRMNEAQQSAWDDAFGAEDAAFQREEPQGQQRVRWLFQRYVKNYLRCVAGVDRSVGALLDWLDAHPDVKANTLVIYSSDQGFYLGDHGWYDKRWMYEESLRMPLLMSWPGRLDGGREIAELTQNIDFAPTFLDLAGVPMPAGLHGRSLLPLLEKREVPWRDAIYYHYYESLAEHSVPAMYGVRTATHKLVRYYEPQWDCQELFDLRADPDELHDVAGDPANAEVLKLLTDRLAALREQYGDDTGQVAGSVFPLGAGITRALREGESWRIWANAQGGYLLRRVEPQQRARLSTTMRPVAGRRAQNGYVVVGGGDERRGHVRVGIDFADRQLRIVGPGGARSSVTKPIEWDGAAPVAVTVTIDLEARRVRGEALGVAVEAMLPPDWQQLQVAGFGADDAETVFTDLRVD